jgi:pimeloyl-ACP methyl ester carboxylesterase
MWRSQSALLVALIVAVTLPVRPQVVEKGKAEVVSSNTVEYKTVQVDGVSIFYREAGPVNAPTLLLLHGFPSSSRMFNPLFERLAGKYHLVAPDYPGFGHSDHPSPAVFAYTFDHLSSVMDHFTAAVGLKSYTLYLQDYGGPVGFRLAIAHPERVEAFIIQNAVAHEDGLGPLWAARRAFWNDRAANEEKLRGAFLSLATTKQRHIGSDPDPTRYDPDLWTDEFAFLSQPGQADIQSDLFYDYRTNVASYPAWQAWLRAHQPRMLVLWGKYDPSFQVAEAAAYKRDVRNAEVHVLDAGHFALDTDADSIAKRIDTFMQQGRSRR